LTVVADQNKKGDFQMEGEGAEIHELKPRDDGRIEQIRDRWARVDSAAAREDEERINRHAMKRILGAEARHSMPALERAVGEIERGCRLLAMAELAEDFDREQELAAAIDRIADVVAFRD
jgi:hypothetical protein